MPLTTRKRGSLKPAQDASVQGFIAASAAGAWRWTRAVASASAVAAAAGCATQAPPVPSAAGVALPAAWSASAPSPAASRDIGSPWWRAFGDAELDRLVTAALVGNTEVAAAQATLRRARALRDVAAAGLRPSLSAGASAQRTQPGAGAGSTRFDLSLDAAWEPDLSGAAGHAVAAAAADERVAERNLAAARLSLAAEVVSTLVQWRTVQARLRIARANLAAQEETLQFMRWRQQAGLASSLEVEQAAAAAAQTRATVPALQASAGQARHALAVLTGAEPTALDATLDARAALPADAPVALDTPLAVLRRRPDVAAAQAALEAAAERVAQADAARRPTLALRASAGWTAATLGALGSHGAAASLLAGLSQPLLDGGQRRAQFEAQEAAFDGAREAYRARVLAALQEVEDTLAALDGARDRVAALRDAEQAAARAAQLAEQRQASGLVDFQAVLDTQRSRLAVQDGRAGAEADVVAARVRLVKALGGGTEGPSAAVPRGTP